jgi:predicted SAM-dependent methyltransferase
MVHEVSDQNIFFKEIYQVLKNNGILFIAEPKGHVRLEKFEASLINAEKVGFKRDPMANRLTGRKALLFKP